VHAHVVAPEVEELAATRAGYDEHAALVRRRSGPESVAVNERQMADLAPLLTDVTARIDRMDAQGIDVQVVSISPTQYHHWVRDAGAAEEIARVSGAAVAAHCARRADRLVGLGSVPQQYPERSVAALREAVIDEGLRGVQLSSHAPEPAGAGVVELSDRRYDELWATACELGAVVVVHPMGCTLEDRLAPWYLSNSVGQPVEHTVALSHLIVGGVLDRFPDLRLVATHGGGYLPVWCGRADHAWRRRPEARTTGLPPSAYLRRIHVDSLVHDAGTLRELVRVLGADRVVLGSDHPFDMGSDDPVGDLRVAGLSDADTDAIRRGNAVRLGLLPTADSRDVHGTGAPS
jgi:aminocarboxymuconate-semialdehyde decarboxylase